MKPDGTLYTHDEMRQILADHKAKTKSVMQPVTYYQSAIGMPFASDGENIASWAGSVHGKPFYGTKSLKQFERDHFPVARLKVITSGMPLKFKRGLLSALRSAQKKS